MDERQIYTVLRQNPDQQQLLAHVRRLVHELEAHKIELERQNEELRTSRTALENGLQRYTELFDFAPIGYATVTCEGLMHDINLEGARLLGAHRSALLGRNLGDFLRSKDNLLFIFALRMGERATDCDAEVCSEEAATPTQLRISASKLSHGEPLTLLAMRDITKQRAQERQLAENSEALRLAHRHKDDFIAVLSHELRNPLAPIRNSLEILAMADLGLGSARQARITIDRQVDHLAHLVDDLLEVSRINCGKIRLRRERVNFSEMVHQASEDQRQQFKSRGVQLKIHLPKEALWVDADPHRLSQIMSNLLGNAEKFTAEGGMVKVTVERTKRCAVVKICDTGAGIDSAVLTTLFEPFTQAPQTMDRTRGGLGLGLAMVKKLAELHGGGVSLTSSGPGCGTEIVVFLPLASFAKELIPDSQETTVFRRRVLIVDDNSDAADSLRDLMELLGHEVKVAYDGVTSLEVARQFYPEAVICDIGLPRMDGYAVARAFRAECCLRSAYLIALSGYAQPEDQRRAMAAGFDQHLAKPPNIKILRNFLSSAKPGTTGTP